MGCGASSAAGDVATATKIDEPAEKEQHQPAEAKIVREAVSSHDASAEGASKPQDPGKKETSKVAPSENVAKEKPSEAQELPAAEPTPVKEQPGDRITEQAPRLEERIVNSVAESAGSPKERSTTRLDETTTGDKAAEREPEAATAASADPLLTKRQSLNKLPPLESPLKALDLAKDPFAKPVLPTSVPVASSPAASPVSIKTPGSLPGTPTLSDSPVAGNRPSENKPLGPSALGKSTASLDAGADVEYTPRTATEAALEGLMDDVSVASK